MKNKSTTTKTARKGPHATPLGSYLSITAGAGAASLLSANGSLVTYNGAAVTATVGQTLYWNPSTMTAGAGAYSITDCFNLLNRDADYVYAAWKDSTIRTSVGVKSLSGYSAVALAKLDVGAMIGVSTPWFGGNGFFAYIDNRGWTTAESPWATGQDGNTGYIPFKFSYNTAPDDTYYGWANITYNDAAQTLVLNNFAYNDTPNASITTGVSPVPEVTSSFTLLGLITGGLMMRRRRDNQASVAVAS